MIGINRTRTRWRGTTVSLALAASMIAMLLPTPTPALAGPNGQIKGTQWEDAAAVSYSAPAEQAGSMYWLTHQGTGAADFWANGYDGSGIDVAVIDTGFVPVPGLNSSRRVVHGPDLSFESQSPKHANLDTFGHGTHMAGIIAGSDSPVDTSNDQKFHGVAPGSRLISIKVGDYQGSTDVSQVIAAIDWVIQHRNTDGMNIKVLNLSFGTDSSQAYTSDPLAYAVERAWRSGIAVVVAAGNDGNGSTLRNPAISPWVIAVGASDHKGTPSIEDDTIASFSSCGTSSRHVDVVAPGKSIISLRSPGSYIDTQYPEARVGERFFLGSGTSQAAAVVSGAAALIFDQRPGIDADQVKHLLMTTARPLNGVSSTCQGAGAIDLTMAGGTQTGSPGQTSQWYPESRGDGSLEAARGSIHVEHNGVKLTGEQDIMGNAWSPWCTPANGKNKWNCSTTKWSGGQWNGTTWSGTTWSGTTWSGTTWSGMTWSGTTWSTIQWSGTTWSGTTWSGTTWSGTTWSGTTWSGAGWSSLRDRRAS